MQERGREKGKGNEKRGRGQKCKKGKEGGEAGERERERGGGRREEEMKRNCHGEGMKGEREGGREGGREIGQGGKRNRNKNITSLSCISCIESE